MTVDTTYVCHAHICGLPLPFHIPIKSVDKFSEREMSFSPQGFSLHPGNKESSVATHRFVTLNLESMASMSM
jgi:hypothetical protein